VNRRSPVDYGAVMAKIHHGATLTPSFRDFLPAWVARQSWYQGSGIPALRPVGTFRFEDPAGEVGLETHLVRDGDTIYQVPMTYRGAPMTNDRIGADPLITTSEHSVLGTRWIYDATGDAVWREAMLRLVQDGASSDSAQRGGLGTTEARGQLLANTIDPEVATIELTRVLTDAPPEPGADGIVMGTWQPNGPDSPVVTGTLAVIRDA
jgi:hypothetical protein